MDPFSLLIGLGAVILSIYILIWPILIHANLSEQTKLLREIARNPKQ